MPTLRSRIDKSAAITLELKALLLQIISCPDDFLGSLNLKKSLSSQGGMASLSIRYHTAGQEFEKRSISLNSLKFHSKNIFTGGFPELDGLRLNALKAITNLESTPEIANKRTKQGLIDKVTELEHTLNKQRIANMRLLQALSEAISSFKSIRDAPNMEVRDKRTSDAIHTIISVAGMNCPPLNSIPNNSPPLNIKDYQA